MGDGRVTEDVGRYVVDGWRVAAATEIGRSHILGGTPCQDRHQARLATDADGQPVLVIVACDGAGSASHSEIGAESVSEGLADATEAWLATGVLGGFSEDLLRGWLANELEQLRATAAEQGVDVRELACTVVMAIVGVDQAWFAQLGDGVIAVRDSDGWGTLITPMHGQYRNETIFLTSAEAVSRAEIRAVSGRVDALAVLTDGIEALVLHYATETIAQSFFDCMIAPLEAAPPGISEPLSEGLRRYLGSDPIRTRTDDDATLVLAWRPSQEPEVGLAG